MGRVEGPKVEKDEIDVMRHIRAEAMVDPSNDTAGFNLFCSKNTPQWFAVQACPLKRPLHFSAYPYKDVQAVISGVAHGRCSAGYRQIPCTLAILGKQECA